MGLRKRIGSSFVGPARDLYQPREVSHCSRIDDPRQLLRSNRVCGRGWGGKSVGIVEQRYDQFGVGIGLLTTGRDGARDGADLTKSVCSIDQMFDFVVIGPPDKITRRKLASKLGDLLHRLYQFPVRDGVGGRRWGGVEGLKLAT